MERMYGIAAITSVCILVILIGVLKKNAEVLLNFAARTVVCFLCSHFLNSFFLARGLDVAVGINLISFLTYGTPVSYTHLDVYKRQSLISAAASFAEITFVLAISFPPINYIIIILLC